MRMKTSSITFLTLLTVALAGCGPDQGAFPQAHAAQPATYRIDPSIATVTIIGKRMSAAEKQAYDQSDATSLTTAPHSR